MGTAAGRRGRSASGLVALLLGAAGVVSAASAVPAMGQEPFRATIGFDEPAFPAATTDAGVVVVGPGTEVTVGYDLFDDRSGEPHEPGTDRDDLTITYRTSPSLLSPATRPDLRFRRSAAGVTQLTGRIAFGEDPTTNNAGTREWYEVEVRFADHLRIDELRLDLFSLNTAGTTWEFSEIGFLDADGAPFSPRATVPPYLDHVPGVNGSDAPGRWLASSTGTVTGVGTDLTAAGTSNPPADGPTLVDQTAVGIDGERLGGFVWRTTLEDVAGVGNGPTSFSSSLRAIELAGGIGDPVAELDLVKAAAPVTVELGDEVTYTLTVTNLGPDVATEVVVTDPLPAAVAPVRDTCGGSLGPPWRWEVGLLGVGEAASCELTVTTLEAATVRNGASASGGNTDGDAEAVADVEVVTPIDPDPTDPDPTDPDPTDPEPTDPDPTDPEPTDQLASSPPPTGPSSSGPGPRVPPGRHGPAAAVGSEVLGDGASLPATGAPGVVGLLIGGTLALLAGSGLRSGGRGRRRAAGRGPGT
jgi:uncharacterized repeat protein (TIGR01451 family)